MTEAPARPHPLRREIPGLNWMRAAGALAARQAAAEAFGTPGYAWTLSMPRAEGFAAAPRDFRPADSTIGKSTSAGRFVISGSVLDVGAAGDPWNRPCPTRRFAVELHRFVWLPDLMASGERVPRDALRFILGWAETFGSWNAFSWSREVLPRRVFNLACHGRRIGASASEADRANLADLLARQTRHLLRLPVDKAFAAEHAAAVSVAGVALDGAAGDALLKRGLSRLKKALPRTVLTDGCHASRSPEAGLELLFDLLTLDDGLQQRGHTAPDELGRAIDRLTAGLRTLTLPDGRLAAFQGGEPSTQARVAAARAHDETGSPAGAERLLTGGYERMDGQLLSVIVDVAGPASGPFARTACAQPAALEITCGRDRLVTNAGWSEKAADREGFRLTPAASTLSLGDGSVGQPLSGRLEAVLGPRLETPPLNLQAKRDGGDGAVLVEVAHDGWQPEHGVRHMRRLYLDRRLDELRAEDRLTPHGVARGPIGFPYAIRFHLFPGVTASVARDRKSILLRGESGRGWWLRSDSPDIAVEPSVCFENGLTRRSLQIVLRGTGRTDSETRIRWKLSPAGSEGQP